MTWRGIWIVTVLELQQRVRSKKFFVALAGWFVLIGLVTALIMQAFDMRLSSASDTTPGPLAFSFITYFVLGLALVVTPTFTATSVNGDRQAGTLALLQATRLSAVQMAAGKLLAAWLTGLVFLIVATPFIAWSMALGNISVWQVVVCFVVLFALVAVISAVGLGWSAILGRPAGSTVMTYLTVLVLTVIAPIAMALLTTVTIEKTTYRVWGLPSSVRAEYQAQVDAFYRSANPDTATFPAPPLDKCAWTEQPGQEQARPDRWAWLLLPNPFIVVADAAPLPPSAQGNVGAYASSNSDGLALVRYGVRALMQRPSIERDECVDLYLTNPGYSVERDSVGNVVKVTTQDGTVVNVNSPVKRSAISTENPLWPWGLGFNVLLGAVFFGLAVKRLSVPYGVLPKGTRVA